MSIEATLEHVSAIMRAMADPSILIGANGPPTGGTEAPAPTTGSAAGESPFARALALASGGEGTSGATASGILEGGAPGSGAADTATPGLSEVANPGYSYGLQGVSGAMSPTTGSGPGVEIVAAAESQIGQAEQPPGSNEGPAIAQYRSATAGAAPGEPWCAYFASWAAQQAGAPIGPQGEGLGSVSAIWSWAQSAGRAVPNGPGVVPKPGDLIVFGGEHVGIVKDVLPNGQIQTIEGNYENKVAANVRSAGEATGYVSMS
jgi:hypothetical protein